MSKKLFCLVTALAVSWLVAPVMAADPGKGNILFEYYTGIGGMAGARADGAPFRPPWARRGLKCSRRPLCLGVCQGTAVQLFV